MGLTQAQERVYRFVRDFILEHGYAPSYEEIRAHLGFKSLNAVYKHLKAIEERGFLKIPWNNRKRALELLPIRTAAASIPFLGVVAAGNPIEPIEIPESVEIPESLLGEGDNFALQVRGNSMIDEGIREGDILIITKQPRAENGQTVVALVQGEATVKKLFHRGATVELRPANTEMEPIRVPEDHVEIVGAVVGLIRNYRHRVSRPF